MSHKSSRGKRGATLLEAVGVRKRTLCDLGPQEELPEARKIRELRSSVKTKKRDDVSFQLPTKLLALRDIFVGVQTVYRMMKHRNKKTTYDELRQGVEEICRKRFEERFLYQLKTLVPDLLELEKSYITTRKTRFGKNSTTIVTLPLDGKISPAETKALLEKALHDYVLNVFRAKHASLGAKKKGSDSSKIDEQFLEILPDIPEWSSPLDIPSPEPLGVQRAASSSPGSSSSHHSVSTKSTQVERDSENKKSRRTCTPSSDIGLQSPRKRTIRVRQPRRLSFSSTKDFEKDMMISKKNGALNDGNSFPEKTNILDDMPSELRRRSLDGIISLSTLHKLNHNETEHRRLSGSEAVAFRAESAALKALPGMLQRIRTIFGRRGPKVMKLDDLVKTIKNGGLETVSNGGVANRLYCLEKHASNFIQIKPWGEKDSTPAVWINRECNFAEILQNLKALSGI
eukprot:jgi/Picsp_1/4801/NSC_02169-R1_dna replication factor cdt1